jgi:DNA-binding response OmpR family regulator
MKGGPVNQHKVRAGAILVVDDCALMRQLVAALLRAAGYRVIAAGDGEAALAFVHRDCEQVSLVLTDVEMPGMNGIDLADRVLEFDRTMPVLFMSGGHTAVDRGYGCLPKPFQASELVTRIGAVLERSSVLTGRESVPPGVANIDQTRPARRPKLRLERSFIDGVTP